MIRSYAEPAVWPARCERNRGPDRGKVHAHVKPRAAIRQRKNFSGIEWDYLHAGKDIPREKLELAIKQHVTTNSHHPEYWGGIEQMPEIAVAEMVVDWYARAMEFGTGLREWIKNTAIEKFRIKTDSPEYKRLQKFVDLLLEDSFVR